MKVINNNGFLSIVEINKIDADVLLIAVLNGAEARKSCEEPSIILRRLAMDLDKISPYDCPSEKVVDVVKSSDSDQTSHLFNQRNIKY